MRTSIRPVVSFAAVVAATATILGLAGLAHALKMADEPAAAAPGPAKVRVVNASPDLGPIELWVDGKKAGGGPAAFKKTSGWAKVPAGTHKIEAFPVKAKGAGTATYSLEEVWTGGLSYTIFVCGLAAEPSSATLEHDPKAPAAGKARVRYFHGAPGLEMVDAALVDGATIGERIAYASNSGYVDADPGKWDLVLRRAGYDAVLHTFPGVDLKKGKIYTLVVAGPEGKREVFGVPE